MTLIKEKLPVILGAVTIISAIIAKYFEAPEIFIICIVITCILQYIYIVKIAETTGESDPIIIRIAKFIIIVGIISVSIIAMLHLFKISWASL